MLKSHQNQIKFLIRSYLRIVKNRIVNLFSYVLNVFQNYLEKIKSLNILIHKIVPRLRLNLTFKIFINRLLIIISRFNWGIKSNPKHKLTLMEEAVVHIFIWNHQINLSKHKLINSSKMETLNVRIAKRLLANTIIIRKQLTLIVTNRDVLN